MSYVESNLIAGEKVLYETGLHWVVLVVPIGFSACIGLLALILLIVGSPGWGVFFILPAAAFILLGILLRKATEMAVTNKRVIVKTGLLSRKTIEVFLSKIESIRIDEDVLGRMLGYGSVVLHGTGGTPESFRTVERPLEFRRRVQSQIEASEQSKLKGQLVTA